jgi:tRNA threonylcarbamoyl adenosine modification protein (Sua5/YciO/YrdC/YwlC family)
MDRIPVTVDWPDAPPAPAALESARLALERGGLVALPTETVYGIAARADRPDALERLAAVKRRPPQTPLTWHVGSFAALERFERVSPLARRLIQRYWPGPLTLVLPGVPRGLELVAAGGWIGVRHPAQLATSRLLAACEFPVAATSANVHGEPPLDGAAKIAERFDGALEIVLDGGRPRLGEASVVLKLGPGSFELVREGILDLAALRATAGLRIGFVCTGNTCRSPLAVGIARKLLCERLAIEPARLPQFGFELVSMGVFAVSGAPASEHSISVARELGADISDHRSRAALPLEIAGLSHVYAMTRSHLDALRLLLPPGADAHCEMLDPSGAEIPDPIGGPREDYVRAAREIERAVRARLDDWA